MKRIFEMTLRKSFLKTLGIILSTTIFITMGVISFSVVNARARDSTNEKTLMNNKSLSNSSAEGSFVSRKVAGDKITNLNFKLIDFDTGENLKFVNTRAAMDYPSRSLYLNFENNKQLQEMKISKTNGVDKTLELRNNNNDFVYVNLKPVSTSDRVHNRLANIDKLSSSITDKLLRESASSASAFADVKDLRSGVNSKINELEFEKVSVKDLNKSRFNTSFRNETDVTTYNNKVVYKKGRGDPV